MKIDVLLFTQTMSSLLKSSLSLQDALDIYSEICENKKDKKFYMKISQNIKNGNLLSSELSNYEKYFSVLYISLVKIGENSGTMIQVFEKLANYLKVKKETKEKFLEDVEKRNTNPISISASAPRKEVTEKSLKNKKNEMFDKK
mgnify:CR=1 FL=1